MTGYGKCCGRRIVAMNWKFCPFCGEALIDGFKVPLRQKIETGMTEMLDRLDTPDYLHQLPNPIEEWNTKALKAAAKRLEISGRFRMNKAALIIAIKSVDKEMIAERLYGQQALFDF